MIIHCIMAYCIGKCKEYKALKPTQLQIALDKKRCNYCETFVDIKELLVLAAIDN